MCLNLRVRLKRRALVNIMREGDLYSLPCGSLKEALLGRCRIVSAPFVFYCLGARL